MIEWLANPLLVFLAVWGTTMALYLAGVFAGTFPFPHPLTVGVLLLNIAAFSLGYLTRSVFKGLAPQRIDSSLTSGRPLTPERMRQALAFTLLMGVIALALILYRVAVIAAYFDTGFLHLLTHPALLRLRLVTFIEAGVSRTSPMVMLLSVTSGLFAVGFVLLGVSLHVETSAKTYACLGGFLLVAFVMCLLNLSRYDMVVSILYLILAYCATGSLAGEKHRPAWGLLLAVLAVAIMFAVVELLLHKGAQYGQSGRLRGFLFSLYWYLASPIAAFDEFLTNFQGSHDLGQNTFFPFFKWLHRLHLVPAPAISVYGEFVFIPHPANVYTYLRNFYEDFGLLGVTVIPYLLGWLIAAIKAPARRCFPFLNLYVALLAPIAFSFYSYPLVSSQFYLQILFGFVLFRYLLSSPPWQADSQAQSADGGRP